MKFGSLSALGKMPGMPSLPTLARFIAARSDFPVLERGEYGKAFVFDLEAAAAFVREHWRDQRRLDPDCAILRQLQLPIDATDDQKRELL